MTTRLVLALLGLFFTSVLLPGCTVPVKSGNAQKEKLKITTPEDSVQYSSVGSWIPRKVKRKEDVIGTNTQVLEGEALQKINERNSTKTTKESQLRGPR